MATVFRHFYWIVMTHPDVDGTVSYIGATNEPDELGETLDIRLAAQFFGSDIAQVNANRLNETRRCSEWYHEKVECLIMTKIEELEDTP